MAVELDVGQPVLLRPGEGEVVGDSEEWRVEILCDRDELCVTWTRFGPGRDAPGTASNRLTCLYELEDGRLLEIRT
jgi:hypothetical protein